MIDDKPDELLTVEPRDSKWRMRFFFFNVWLTFNVLDVAIRKQWFPWLPAGTELACNAVALFAIGWWACRESYHLYRKESQ